MSRFIIIICIFLCTYTHDVHSFEGTGDECNILLPSGVVCVTETEFKLAVDDPDLFSCPDRTVCANYPEICVRYSQPACTTERCGRCLHSAISTCDGTKQYVDCVGGVLGSTVRTCPASRAYCSVVYEEGIPQANCTSQIEEMTCNETTTTPSIPDPEPETPCPPAADQCTEYGKFQSTADRTCRKYYYCSWSYGELVKSEYICPDNLVYNPLKGKCVPADSYQCV